MKNIQNLTLILLLLLNISCLKEDDAAIQITPLSGDTLTPDVGGATQSNQVWVDLSTHEMTTKQRPEWDLAFYSGEQFKVVLNNSIMMAAGSINASDIDAVDASNFSELLDIFEPAAGWPAMYIDDLAGNYLEENGTAIQEISPIDSENLVYLVKLGYDTYNGGNIPPYSVYSIGDSRGYKKIRILRQDENSYKIQYADLNDTNHSEFIVDKSMTHHFQFFSFTTESIVEIQPEITKWDLCFTIFNNEIPGFGTYTYADFILTNTMDGVATYQIITDPLTANEDYENFNLDQVDESLFQNNDHRSIGGNWRSTVSGTTSTPEVYGDRFYVLKDPDGILYKLRFLSMLDENNMRGFPKFEYEPL